MMDQAILRGHEIPADDALAVFAPGGLARTDGLLKAGHSQPPAMTHGGICWKARPRHTLSFRFVLRR
jgi:hypothetical protein